MIYSSVPRIYTSQGCLYRIFNFQGVVSLYINMRDQNHKTTIELDPSIQHKVDKQTAEGFDTCRDSICTVEEVASPLGTDSGDD